MTERGNRVRGKAFPSVRWKMSKILVLGGMSVVVLVVASGCSSKQPRGQVRVPAEILCCLERPPGGDEVLCYLNTDVQEHRWFGFRQGSSQPWPVEIPLAGSWVRAALFSPDGRFLAVLLAEEGHPIVAVLRAQDGPGMAWEFVGSMDPYPGSIRMVRWRGEKLVLEADVDLTIPSGGRAEFSGDVERYVAAIAENRLIVLKGE